MKIKPLKQRDSIACGPTAIKMTIDYFGVPISFKEIARISKYKSLDGMSNIDLVNTLKSLGLETEISVTTSWEKLQSLNTEKNVIIVSWMFKGYIGHFSVVDKVSKTHIYLAEPTTGKVVKLEKIIFMRLWFDYDDMWFPEKNTDIQMRFMVVISKKP